MIATNFPAVPISDRIAQMIGATIPLHVLQAEVDADGEFREVLGFRPLACDEDRADRELALARMARANKTLAAYNPGLVIHAGGAR